MTTSKRMENGVSASESETNATSPCVLICSIESSTGYCWGCGRTIEEISGWAVYPLERREEVARELPGRLATLPVREKRVTKRRRQRESGGAKT